MSYSFLLGPEPASPELSFPIDPESFQLLAELSSLGRP